MQNNILLWIPTAFYTAYMGKVIAQDWKTWAITHHLPKLWLASYITNTATLILRFGYAGFGRMLPDLNSIGLWIPLLNAFFFHFLPTFMHWQFIPLPSRTGNLAFRQW
jgi:hypothetical protein